MATKPTDRILDWASGGTATDPGGSKEAQGWSVGERPPAYWWNWILNSFGQWLSWAEGELDEYPETVRTRVLGAIESVGGSDTTPVIKSDTTAVGIDTPQAGDVTSAGITVRFTTPFADDKYTPIITVDGDVAAYYIRVIISKSATGMTVGIGQVSDGAALNPLSQSLGFYMDIKGAQ